MNIKFKKVFKAWFITALIAATINVIWFYINTIAGNPWSEILFINTVIITSFGTVFIGSLVYWSLTFKFKKADLIFAVGAIALTVLSVMGHPTLKDGTPVPGEFRVMDIPMHFVAGLLCAFLVPAIARDRLFKKKSHNNIT
jgi:hypothetical protein